MTLLMESKRVWLLSYCVVLAFIAIIYHLAGDSVIGKTICVLLIDMQLLMLVFFFLIHQLKKGIMYRTILTILYIGSAIYLGINHVISKWYVIVPTIIMALIYMFWNMGGVINCVIASEYKERIDRIVDECKNSYKKYSNRIDEYNKRNGLSFGTKIKTIKEPNWNNLGFNSSGSEMFCFTDILFGNIFRWERKISKLNSIISELNNKHEVLRLDEEVYDEKYIVNRIRDKGKSVGLEIMINDAEINAEIRKDRKAIKKRLRKKW